MSPTLPCDLLIIHCKLVALQDAVRYKLLNASAAHRLCAVGPTETSVSWAHIPEDTPVKWNALLAHLLDHGAEPRPEVRIVVDAVGWIGATARADFTAEYALTKA